MECARYSSSEPFRGAGERAERVGARHHVWRTRRSRSSYQPWIDTPVPDCPRSGLESVRAISRCARASRARRCATMSGEHGARASRLPTDEFAPGHHDPVPEDLPGASAVGKWTHRMERFGAASAGRTWKDHVDRSRPVLTNNALSCRLDGVPEIRTRPTNIGSLEAGVHRTNLSVGVLESAMRLFLVSVVAALVVVACAPDWPPPRAPHICAPTLSSSWDLSDRIDPSRSSCVHPRGRIAGSSRRYRRSPAGSPRVARADQGRNVDLSNAGRSVLRRDHRAEGVRLRRRRRGRNEARSPPERRGPLGQLTMTFRRNQDKSVQCTAIFTTVASRRKPRTE